MDPLELLRVYDDNKGGYWVEWRYEGGESKTRTLSKSEYTKLYNNTEEFNELWNQLGGGRDDP